MWILTRVINEYDQDGDYFFCAWNEKPNVKDLVKVTERDEDYCNRILNNEGRLYPEHTWFWLTEMKNGEVYAERG